MTTKKRLEEIEQMVETTKKEGAKILCGGQKPSGFNKDFYEPTVCDNIKDDFTIMKLNHLVLWYHHNIQTF
jgi:succinate-semialdehyde dehydrogenase/glutarate-semialdehyde dehydrogenase